jgi:hypothetical protein
MNLAKSVMARKDITLVDPMHTSCGVFFTAHRL